MTYRKSAFATRELFRFARVSRPRVVDVGRRVEHDPELEHLSGAEMEEWVNWARNFRGSKSFVTGSARLKFPYRKHLRLAELPRRTLPTRAALKNPVAFAALDVRGDDDYRSDVGALRRSLLAARLLEGRSRAGGESVRLARLLDFVENFPDLLRVRRTRPLATPVLGRRLAREVAGQQGGGEGSRASEGPRSQAHIEDVAREERRDRSQVEVAAREPRLPNVPAALDLLWRVRNARLDELQAEASEAYRKMMDPAEGEGLPPLPPLPRRTRRSRLRVRTEQQDEEGEVRPRLWAREDSEWSRAESPEAERARAEAVAERARLLRERSRERTRRARELKRQHEEARRGSSLAAILATPEDQLEEMTKYAAGASKEDVRTAMAAVAGFLKEHDIPKTAFCVAYERAVATLDVQPKRQPVEPGEGCFTRQPELAFEDTVRILGRGELIRVDETFVKYSPGEISYVETMLAGEVRTREVKRTRYFEQSTERVTDETTDVTKETQVRTEQELRTQVTTELSTRFASDLSASANASGGGTIGVVDVEGGAGLDASVGIGVDAGLSTSQESEFSQEILSRAVERAKNSVLERRATRSYSLDEVINHHSIDNTIGTPRHRNGVYCFLNKHVRLTETVYGQRVFLLANVTVPGHDLLCARNYRLDLALEDVGARPIFDISPADVTPATYLALAGRFRAQNVEPPPSPVARVVRTYKTDTTNASSEPVEFKARQIADVLVPYFERYKRHLLTDNVRLPDGYEVVEVAATVNHGENGVSIPAHLPLTVAGATAYMGPAMAAYIGYGPILMPYWLWYIGYLASPMLHYNADSSNVTLTIGNESKNSPYYFFRPDFLIQEIFDLVGTVAGAVPGILGQIEDLAKDLFTSLQTNASQLPDQVGNVASAAVGNLITQLQTVFERIFAGDLNGMWTAVQGLAASVSSQSLQGLQSLMGSFFQPVQDFFASAFAIIDQGIGAAIADLFSFFSELFESSRTLVYAGAMGARGELPISLNAICIKPGVTVNVSACLRRTPEALDAWRLQTFGALYQAYLQQLADWESRTAMTVRQERLEKPPAMLRGEERAAVKARVLHALNNVRDANGTTYTLDRMAFFEHAIDWENLSYRLFHYGPTAEEVLLEKRGALAGADDRRRVFLTATWAQVLVPLRADERLEDQVRHYFDTGITNLEGDLQDEELIALYQELVLARESVVGTQVGEPREEVLPTELIVLVTEELESELPMNEALAGSDS